MRLRLLFLIFIVALSGCAASTRPTLFTGEDARCFEALTSYYDSVEQRRDFALPFHMDNRFPHLAFDRFSLAMNDTLSQTASRSQWLSYVSKLGQQQLETTLVLSPPTSSAKARELTQCQDRLAARSADSPAFWQALQNQPPVIPTAYQHWKRVLGVYPIASLVAKGRIEAEQARIQNDAGRPLSSPVSYGELPAPMTQKEIRTLLSSAQADSPTRWPLLSASAAARLLDHYSPSFSVETLSRNDLPGALVLDDSNTPTIDSQQPTLYRALTYTRFNGQILPQLNYVLWFAARPAKRAFAPYSGQFDAVNIRLTLDQNGQPLILDSIHQCGCYHAVYALNSSLRFRQFEGEKPIEHYLLPTSDTGRFHVSLTGGEHMIHGVQLTTGATPDVVLQGREMLETLTLKSRGGQYFSPYDREGILPESVRAERWFLWPFGVRSPGAMRQHGKHAIAFIGERHFDDAFLFDSLLLQK